MRSIFFVLALALAAPAIAAPREAPPKLRYALDGDTVAVPMRFESGHILVDVTIGGKGPFPFVFDTGASGGVMDLAFAREQGFKLGDEARVGSPTGGGLTGRQIALRDFRLGGLTVKSMPVVAFEGLPFRPGATKPSGVIGPYGFQGLLVTLDYPNERLVFTRGSLPEPDGRETFGWDASQKLPLLPIDVAGHRIDVHLDSGAMNGLSLPLALADSLPLASPPVELGRARLVDRTAVIMGAPLTGTLTLGRYTLENPKVVFSEIFKGMGNVGPPILRQFALTIDPAHRRLRLAGPADGRLAAPAEPVRSHP